MNNRQNCSTGRGVGTRVVTTIWSRQPIYGPKGHRVREKASDETFIRWLVEAGTDVFRLNLSHRSQDGLRERDFIAALRRVRRGYRERGRHIGMMLDLQGPKLRIGALESAPSATRIMPGAEFTLHTHHRIVGDATRACVLHGGEPFEQFGDMLSAGSFLHLGDGAVTLRVIAVSDRSVRTRVSRGGEIASGAGISVPGAKRAPQGLTAKDREDLAFFLPGGDDVTHVAISMVNGAADVLHVRDCIVQCFRNAQVPAHELELRMPLLVAKIETRAGLGALDEILDVADAVMVARGDLASQIGLERVTQAQKKIVRCCNARGKPVIVATEILESMTKASRPTRAEASDAYNAILDGADALMLSAETARGHFPIQSVRWLMRFARQAERDFLDQTDIDQRAASLRQKQIGQLRAAEIRCAKRSAEPGPWQDVYRLLAEKHRVQITTASVIWAAFTISRGIRVDALVPTTATGLSARLVAPFRPTVPCIAAVHHEYAARRLALSFGVQPIEIDESHRDHEALMLAVTNAARASIRRMCPAGLVARNAGCASSAWQLVVTAGRLPNVPGSTSIAALLPFELAPPPA